MGLDYAERTPEEGVAAANAGFTLRAAKANMTHVMESVQVQDLTDVLSDFVGKTDLNNGQPTGFGLKRLPPKAHPLWPWLYCSNLANIQGVGKCTRQKANLPPMLQMQGLVLPEWLFYETYFVTTEYSPRGYPVLNDSLMPQFGLNTWYSESNPAGYFFQFVPEWLRFCEFSLDSVQNYITFQQGQMTFTDRDGNPDGKPFAAMPRIYLPDQIIKVRWYAVPYRFIVSKNSYIRRFTGRINQFDWWNWEAAQMLYLSYNATPYNPPVPDVMQLPALDNATTFSNEKLCDIEFAFLLTRRFLPAGNAPVPANRNYIPSGHNLLPFHGTRRFHYATVSKSGPNIGDPNGQPMWLSFPAQLLFVDPDQPQQVAF